jgi:hypothetical protein
MKCVGVKYCGGCNPHIERSGFVDKLKEKFAGEGELRLTICRGTGEWDLGILVCGCPVACADRPETRSRARKWIVVAGPNVDLESMPEEEMATAVALRIKKYFEEEVSS